MGAQWQLPLSTKPAPVIGKTSTDQDGQASQDCESRNGDRVIELTGIVGGYIEGKSRV